MVTSASHLLDMPPRCPVTVRRTGPSGASRRISIGAPGAVSLPMTLTVPPGWTVDRSVVRETGATQAQETVAGTMTAKAANAPATARRRCDRGNFSDPRGCEPHGAMPALAMTHYPNFAIATALLWTVRDPSQRSV